MVKTVHALLVFLGFFIYVGVLWNLRTVVVTAQTDCDVDCLNDKIVALTKRVVTLEKKTGTAKKTGTFKENFVAIGSATVDGANDWTKVSGSDFWLDLSLYGEVSEVTMQGWIDNGSGRVRLYDSTNSRVVDFSEISVKNDSSNSTSFYTKAVSIWRGQNQYYLQVRGNGNTRVELSGVKLKVLSR